MQPDAMRHYSTTSAAVARHQPWVDAAVLVSTLLFGLLLALFVLEVAPTAGSPRAILASAFGPQGLIASLIPPPPALPLQPVGTAQSAQDVVAQVVEPRRSGAEGGREAGPGREFVVVTAVVENQSRRPISFSLEDWKIVDASGRPRSAEAIRGAGWLSGARVDPGMNVRGALAFAVAQGEGALEIRFTAPALQAMMRWDATPTAAPDA
jgi:hypothetical protein